VAFKQLVRAEVAAGLDETHQFESWAADVEGQAYYDVHLSVIDERESCVPALRRELGERSGWRILESGCGTGRWMAFFARLGHRPFGIDDSPAPLAVARSHAPDLPLVRADARASPFKPASFDAVFSSYVAEHFEEGPAKLLEEIRRVLKPGGVLFIVVPFDSPFRRLFTHRVLEAYYRLARRRGQKLAFTEYRFSRREMERFLEQSGFRVEHVEPDDFRLPWAKGLRVDFGELLAPRGAAKGGWELNVIGRVLSRCLRFISPWFAAAGIFFVARRV
jgi:ubiquinone/menaquinone biosynthesis C-methylase UbiE